ncbi:MAG: hypothetical protein LBR84_06500 [Tannerella sp.]|nr:hypothetical protein [Tannerella sp.]
MKRFSLFCAVVFVLAALGSCGARKNTSTSRFYHSLNSRYNIYYNGKTSFDEALKSMYDGYKESYVEQIHMFPVSGIYQQEKTKSGGAFDRAIEKGNKAIKLHSIKDKPARKAGWQSDPRQVKLQQQEEFNPFMKHCWLLIAASHYYNGDFLEAAVTYSYIIKHFTTDPELVAEARIRQARCYNEMNWFYETNTILKKLKETGVPTKLQSEYDRMYADYLIRNEQAKQAIPYLESSIKTEKNKRQKSRQRYLLGQIYKETEQNDLAYKTFGKLAASNPPYEIEFAARIRQTEVFPGGNYEKVIKMLRRMSKSDKNKDFLDQVFYAMGNVYMTRPDTVKAIECYAEGIEKSTQNGMDKAICQIRLGDIYFTQKDYLKAQPCFSGALSGLQKEYKDYQRIAKLSETLDELVVHYEAVHLQDSLQTLAKMPEEERLAVIDKIIEQVIEEEKKAQEEAEKEEYLAAASTGTISTGRKGAPTTPTMPTMPSADNSSFYFYNTQVVAQGKTQFQNKWGKRTLEDNWRRRNKKMELMMSDETADNNTNATMPGDSLDVAQSDSLSAKSDSLADDPKSREYYLQQIPFSEEDLAASDKIIEDGLYNMGLVYKDKLENKSLTVETFEELDRRFPENEYRLDYYYQLYLMALRYGDDVLAEKYKAKLIAEFPESDYATAISDPNYIYNMRVMDSVQDSIYEETYEAYLAEDTATVRRNYLEFSAKYPLAKLMPKFMFINALTYVQSGDAARFKDELTLLTEKYPDADVTTLASEMLKGLLRGRKLMQTSFSKLTWDMRFGVGEDGILSSADSLRRFSDEKNAPHRMLLVYTTGSIDRNQLLYTVAAYNFANFRVKAFDLSFEEIGSITIFTISGFGNFDEIIEYYRMIHAKNSYAAALEGIISFFPISDPNYETLIHGKTLEEYMTFFIENYGEAAPDLTNQWRLRVEVDRKELEATEAADKAKSPEKQEETSAPVAKSTPVLPEKIETSPLRAPSLSNIIVAPAKFVIPVYDKPDENYDEALPEAQGGNIFQKLIKRVKETDEFKTLEESVTKIKDLAEEEAAPVDSIAEKKPLERDNGELTFDQIQELRKREAEEQAIKDAENALSKEEAEKAEKELKKQQAADREKLRKQKEKEAKERLRQKEKERKERLKQREKERRDKEKAKKAAQKEKAANSKKKKPLGANLDQLPAVGSVWEKIFLAIFA